MKFVSPLFVWIIIVIAAIMNAFSASGQAQWTRIYGGPSYNHFNCIVAAAGDGYFAAGSTGSWGSLGWGSSTLSSIYLVRTDSIGKMIWQKTIGNGSHSLVARRMVIVQNGDLFVAGNAKTSLYGNDDIFVAKLDTSGNLIWINFYGTVNDFETIGDIVEDGNDLVVSGSVNQTSSLGTGADITIFKVSNSGSLIWTKTYGEPISNEQGFGVCRLHDGTFMIAGHYNPNSSGAANSGIAIRVDANGDTLWTKIIPEYKFNDCTELKGDSVIAFVGSRIGFFGNLCTVRLDPSGNILSVYNSSALADVGARVKPLDDGGFIVLGGYGNFGFVAALYRFNDAGAPIIWTSRYFHMDGTSYSVFSTQGEVLVDDDGGFIWVGAVNVFSGSSKATIIKTDYQGQMAAFVPVNVSVQQPQAVCAGSTITVSVPDLYDHYQWFWYNNNDNVSWVPNSNSHTITVDSSYKYRCVMWNEDGSYNISNYGTAVVSTMPDTIITNVGSPSSCPPYHNLRVKNERGSTYTWKLNGTPMSGFNSYQLIPQVSGNYSVEISNACTTLTTSPVYVQMITPVYDLGPDTIYMPLYNGSTTGCYPPRLSAPLGNGWSYQWYYNGTSLPATNSYYDVLPQNPGYYYVSVQNNCGIVFSDTTWVLYDTIASLSLSVTGTPSSSLQGCANQFLTLRVPNPYHNSGLSYYWYKNGVLAGTTSNGDFRPSLASTGLDTGYFHCLIADTCGNQWAYFRTDSVFYAEDNSSRIISIVGGGQAIACTGSTITLRANQTSANYQWYKDTISISGATSQDFVVTSSGNYRCEITRPCGQYFTDYKQTHIGTLPSVIIADATDLCVSGNDTLKVRIQALHDQGLNTFQWRLNGVNIPGATSYFYETKVPGMYDCVFIYNLSSPCDTIISNAITLSTTVIPNTITADNFGKYCPGGTVALHAPSGFNSYQWYNSLTIISGATDSIYMADTSSSYRVKVTSGSCSVFTLYTNTSEQRLPQPNNIMPENHPLSCGNPPVKLTANNRYDLSYQWYLNGLPLSGGVNQHYFASGGGQYTVSLTDSIGCTTTSEPLLVDPAWLGNIILSTGNNSLQCEGDTILISVSGNYASYQWYYNNSVIPNATSSVLETDSAGIYSVLVTDNSGCAGTAQTLISFVPPPVITNMISSPGTCSLPNGGISLAFSQPVEIVWNGPTPISSSGSNNYYNPTGLNPGWYYFTYNFAGSNCAFIDSIEIVSLPTLNVHINAGSGSICQGSSIYVSNSTAGYQFLWSSGQTTANNYPSQTGWYTITVTETATGCSGSDSVFVTVFPLPTVSIQPTGTQVICGTGSVSLDAGSGFVNYQWSNGLSSSTIVAYSAGNYIVTVTDSNGCKNKDTTLVIVSAPPSITALATGPTSFCVGGNVTLTTAGSVGNYQWYRYNIPLSGDTNSSLFITHAGSYRCLITDGFGCSTFSNPITVTTPCQPPQDPVDKLTTDNSVNEPFGVFPNPGSGFFNILVPKSIIARDFKLYDLSGREIIGHGLFQQASDDLFLLDLQSAKAGIYYITLTDLEGVVHRKRVVKL